jgi:hypothetical protein
LIHNLFRHHVGCGIWVQETVAEEGVLDLESDIERCELTILGERVSHLVDKKRKVFRRITLNGFRRESLNFLPLALKRLRFQRKFLKRGIALMGKAPFPFGGSKFDLEDSGGSGSKTSSSLGSHRSSSRERST